MPETQEKVRADLEHLQAHVAIDNVRAATSKIKARATCWSVVAMVLLLSAPAAVIFVYAALWRWLQR